MVGWGVAARLEVRGRERFSRTQRWWNQLCASAVIDDTVAVPGTGAVAFGSFAFDPERDMSVVIVPKVVLGRRGGQSWITTIGLGTADPTEVSPVTSLPKAPTSVTWSGGSRERADWESSIADAIARINAGEIDKVVLARDIIADAGGEPLALVLAILRVDPLSAAQILTKLDAPPLRAPDRVQKLVDLVCDTPRSSAERILREIVGLAAPRHRGLHLPVNDPTAAQTPSRPAQMGVQTEAPESDAEDPKRLFVRR